jgi:hypothetical protein
LAAGEVAIAIKRRDDAEGLLIYVEGRLSWWPLSTSTSPNLIFGAYIRAMGHIDTCLGILRRLIAKGDVNGIPLAKRAINEYWDAAPVQARESGLRFVQQDVLDQRNAVTGDHRNFADTVNAYIEKKLAANRAAKRPT